MRRFGPALTVLLLSLFAVTSPALAQGGGSEGKSQNFLQMFIVPTGSFDNFANILGTMMIWIIILLSVVGTSLIVQYAMRFRAQNVLPRESIDALAEMLDNKKYREAIEYSETDPAYVSKLVNAALKEAPNGFGGMERAMEEVADLETTRMLRPMEWLNLLGNIAPMLGLFGTVYGMIVAFSILVAEGGRPDPAKLAGGISTALVTTFWGLIVAMPCLAAYSIIRNKVDALATEGMMIAEDLLKQFKPGAAKKPAAAAPARADRPRATPKPE